MNNTRLALSGLACILLATCGCATRHVSIDDLAANAAQEAAVLNDSLLPQVQTWLAEARAVGMQHIDEPQVEQVYPYTEEKWFESLDGAEQIKVDAKAHRVLVAAEGYEGHELIKPIRFERTDDPRFPYVARFQVRSQYVTRHGAAVVTAAVDTPKGFRLVPPGVPEEEPIIPITRFAREAKLVGQLWLPAARAVSEKSKPELSPLIRDAYISAATACLQAEPRREEVVTPCTLWYSISRRSWVNAHGKE